VCTLDIRRTFSQELQDLFLVAIDNTTLLKEL
jgi:hypothetical protein